MEQTVKIEKKMLEIEERGVKLRLTIVDTPGFGDAVNNEQCWQPVEEFVDSQFEQYFKVGLGRMIYSLTWGRGNVDSQFE